MDFGIVGVGAITAISYLCGSWAKSTGKVDKYIPEICGSVGLFLGIIAKFIMPDFPAEDLITAGAIGVVSGFSATGINQMKKQLEKEE